MIVSDGKRLSFGSPCELVGCGKAGKDSMARRVRRGYNCREGGVLR